MIASALFLGQGGANPSDGAFVWQLSDGADDVGTPFNIYAMSNWIRPSGTVYVPQGIEFAFYDAYVTISWSMAVSLVFTPILEELPDSIAWPGGQLATIPFQVDLVAPASGRTTKTFRIPLMRKFLDAAGNEQGRTNLVGARMRLQVATLSGLGLGDLILSGAEVEYEQQLTGARQENPA